MSDLEEFEILVLGSGEAGKYLAWTMATEGHRTALVERRWLGGSCPNIACLPAFTANREGWKTLTIGAFDTPYRPPMQFEDGDVDQLVAEHLVERAGLALQQPSVETHDLDHSRPDESRQLPPASLAAHRRTGKGGLPPHAVPAAAWIERAPRAQHRSEAGATPDGLYRRIQSSTTPTVCQREERDADMRILDCIVAGALVLVLGGCSASSTRSTSGSSTPSTAKAGVAQNITLTIQNGAATVGGMGTVEVDVGGAPSNTVNNAQLDVLVPSDVYNPSVSGNAVVGCSSRYSAANGFAPTSSLPTSPAPPAGTKRLRLSVIDTMAMGRIGNGPLYTCNLPVLATATAGMVAVNGDRNNVGDTRGNVLPSSVGGGSCAVRQPASPYRGSGGGGK